MQLEDQIFHGLLTDQEYVKKVLPYIKEEYLTTPLYKAMFNTFKEYYETYNVVPSIKAFCIDLKSVATLSDDQIHEGMDKAKTIYLDGHQDREWLIDRTEGFCKSRSVYNAIMESIQIIDGKSDKKEESLPDVLADALAVSFDTHIGHDYLADGDERYEFYNAREDKIPFDLDYLNRITKGGLSRKSLNVALAGTGVGKTLLMTHMASACLMQGYNVLYITLEMAEFKIAQRIDANLMNVTMDELSALSKPAYNKKLDRVKSNTTGKLVIKEYPPGSAHVGHFRHLLNELKLKQEFKPDIIFIDYLNLCASARSKMTSMYEYNKIIAEELRGLGVEKNLPVMTATQVNRTGFTSSDIGLEDTSESFGIPATADLMFAISTSEEYEQLGLLAFKQLKNRYNDPSYCKRFVVGVDRSKMKLFDAEETAQENIMQADSVVEEQSGSSLTDNFGDFK